MTYRLRLACWAMALPVLLSGAVVHGTLVIVPRHTWRMDSYFISSSQAIVVGRLTEIRPAAPPSYMIGPAYALTLEVERFLTPHRMAIGNLRYETPWPLPPLGVPCIIFISPAHRELLYATWVAELTADAEEYVVQFGRVFKESVDDLDEAELRAFVDMTVALAGRGDTAGLLAAAVLDSDYPMPPAGSSLERWERTSDYLTAAHWATLESVAMSSAESLDRRVRLLRLLFAHFRASERVEITTRLLIDGAEQEKAGARWPGGGPFSHWCRLQVGLLPKSEQAAVAARLEETGNAVFREIVERYSAR